MTDLEIHIRGIRSSFSGEIDSVAGLEDLDSLRVRFLGKKGAVTALLKSLGTLPSESRPQAGQLVNVLRDELEERLQAHRHVLEERELDRVEREDRVDVTFPSRGRDCGGFHPVVETERQIVEIMSGLGFSVALGPEVEEDFYNFEALNIPPSHPARDMQDSFYFPDGRVLRTHTSPVEVRAMRAHGAPIRIVVPGKVYRRDSDPTHSPMFHQLEGLMVDTDVSIADLKGCLGALMNAFFDRPLAARYRGSYFPFTEPSMELDIECIECSGRNPSCRICKGTGWLEVAGLGMTHPDVLRAGGVDPERYTGFAWGMGLDRMAMLKYGLTDLRVLFEGNVPYLLSGRNRTC
jgi:phenylalanyl-tRNA synthetase alpha chain